MENKLAAIVLRVEQIEAKLEKLIARKSRTEAQLAASAERRRVYLRERYLRQSMDPAWAEKHRAASKLYAIKKKSGLRFRGGAWVAA